MIENRRVSPFAGSGNRLAAFLLDSFLLGAAVGKIEPLASSLLPEGWTPAILWTLLVWPYFGALPASPLQGTPGQWIFRIRVADRGGRRLGWGRAFLRAGALLGWYALCVRLSAYSLNRGLSDWLTSAIWLAFPLPWAAIFFMPRGESPFDLLAGALVVSRKATPEAVAEAEALRRTGYFRACLVTLPFLILGYLLATATLGVRDLDRRVRIRYAVEQIMPVKEKIADFYAGQARWPTAAELGLPEWTPYRDGGGYRLQADGGILVEFSVLPGLKGHSLTYSPQPSDASAALQWRCRADPGFTPKWLPYECR